MPHPLRALPLVALALVAGGHPGVAQSLWPDSLRVKVEFGGEWIRPTLAQYDDAYPASRGVWTVSGRARIRENLELVVAFPNFVGAGDGVVAGGGNGDPYIGVLLLDAHRRPRLAFGYRPGIASHDQYYSPSIGEVADHDRAEASYTDAASVNAVIFHEAYRGANGTNIRLRLGSTLAFAAGYGGVGGNLLFDYGLRVGRDTPWLRAGLAFTGRWWMDSEGEGWGEAASHQAAVEFSFLPGDVRPYLGARIPIDRPLSAALDYALIVGVTAGVR